jgi:urea transport system substrate-binding protein
MLRVLVVAWAIVLVAGVAAAAALSSGSNNAGAGPIRVGILHSETGSLAISEIPVIDATRMGIDDLNAHGGVLGRKIEVFELDGKSDDTTFARDARILIYKDKVSVIFGCWTSACRKTVEPIVEQAHNVLFYPLQYEGLEDSPNVVYLGAAPNQQIIPAVKWFLDNVGARFYLIGSDYIFPRAANAIVKDYLRLYGGKVVGEAYVPLGGADFTGIVRQIKRDHPSVIFNTVNGASNIALFTALHDAHITAAHIPVVSFSIAEQEVKEISEDIGTDALVGNYAVWNYFASLDTPQNLAFVKEFHARFGQGCSPDDPVEAAYIGVRLWGEAVRDAGSANPMRVLGQIGSESYDAPEGMVYVDDENHHLWKTTRIGQIMANGQFNVIWESEAILHPVPFPPTRTTAQWVAFENGLYEKWHGWEAPPVPTSSPSSALSHRMVMGGSGCQPM